eukprot:g25027.t1
MWSWKGTADQTASKEQERQRFGPKPFIRTGEGEGGPRMEEAKDGHVTRRVEGGVKVDDNRNVRLLGACRVQIRKLVPESPFGLLDIEETTSGATD